MALFRRRQPPPPNPANFRGHILVGGRPITLPDEGFATGAQPGQSHSARRPTIVGAEAAMRYGNAHSVVSGCVVARSSLLKQLRPVFRDDRTSSIVPGRDLRWFDDRKMMGEVLDQMENHGSFTGNAYVYRNEKVDRLQTLQPDATELILETDATPDDIRDLEAAGGSIMDDLNAEVIAYAYQPFGHQLRIIPAEFVAHWMPERHPLHSWLGRSWVSAVTADIARDLQADEATNKFFEHGSSPALVFLTPKDKSPEEVARYKAVTEADVAGVLNFRRNLYVGGGTDVKVVGASLKDIGLKDIHGHVEERICGRARVPAVIAQIASGMQGSALNSGNYDATRRMWSDGFIQSHMDSAAAALGSIVKGPTKDGNGSFLSWDPKLVKFMQEDEKDAADIRSKDAQTIRTYTDAGFTWESAVAAVENDDLTLLDHTGLFSVQLQPPGTAQPEGGNE